MICGYRSVNAAAFSLKKILIKFYFASYFELTAAILAGVYIFNPDEIFELFGIGYTNYKSKYRFDSFIFSA